MVLKSLSFKDSAHQAHLVQGIPKIKCFGLTFLELTHHFTPFDCGAGRLHKPLCDSDYPFQLTVVAFRDVIPVLNMTVFNVRRTPAFAFEQRERTAVCRSFIRVDESRDLPPLHVVEGFTQESVCSGTLNLAT